jgi:hypothetical protein
MDTKFVAVGDLNNDGKPDLAVANDTNQIPSRIAVLLGDGAGAFAVPVYYTVDRYPRSISIGDFDGDGKADFGVANYYSGSVQIFTGDGAGHFANTANYLKVAPTATVAGDFNGDGRSELAATFGDGLSGTVDLFYYACKGVPEPSPTPDPGPTYSISGQVVNSTFTWTHVRLSGTQGGTASVDNTGHYVFSGLPSGGAYTVTPYNSSNLETYSYSPSNRTFDNLSSDQVADFVETKNAYSISGQVVDAAGVGLAGITVTLGLSPSGATQTDGNGRYSIPNLSPGQTYRVSPASTLYTFSPQSYDFISLSGNQTANFTAIPLYNITGRITDSNGVAVAGVHILVNGPMSRSTDSDSKGNYLINSLPAGGNYSMTLSGVGYAFDPHVKTFNNLSGHQTVNFTAIPALNISGRVTTVSGQGIGGVIVTLSGSDSGGPYTMTTNTFNHGEYFLEAVAGGGSYTITPSKSVNIFQPTSQTLSNLSGQQTVNFIGSPSDVKLIQLAGAGYSNGEASGHVDITVTRIGDISAGATVNYATSDTAGLQNCNVINNIASSRCDYATSIGTLRFAAGENSKAISIPIVDDNFTEGNETFTITLSSPTGAALNSPTTATVTITDNASTAGNPIDSVPFFVRQNYIDFLGREPDSFGNTGWQAMLNNCAAGDTSCDRIEVSSRFFRSAEFQERGYFTYRFYSASFGRKPNYEEFIPDVAKVSGFLTDAEKEANKVAFVDEFMQRPEFRNKYDLQTTPTAYVDALLTTAGLPNHPSRAGWVAGLINGSLTRAQVLRQLAESGELSNKYNVEAFVVMQYFGYLRRNPDKFYLDWIAIMNQDRANYRNMVNGFMNSQEYRARFGQ